MKLTAKDIHECMEYEARWCAVLPSPAEQRRIVTMLESQSRIEPAVFGIVRPPLPQAVLTLIESVTSGRELREDVTGTGVQGDAGTNLTMPEAWGQNGYGVFTHAKHGKITASASGAWRHHAPNGQILRAGVGQESLSHYVKTLGKGTTSTDDSGPAGTSAESAHTVLHRALTGATLQEHTLPADAHVTLAKAFGHSGAITLREDEQDTRPDPESVHERLARALRS